MIGKVASASQNPLAERIDEIRRYPKLAREVVHVATLPAEEPRYGAPESPLPGAIVKALAATGVDRLWSHQVEGLEAVRRGENVLVTTPTASGKSLLFQLPVLEEALRGGPGRALFLFPLKALGQDQQGKFHRLVQGMGLGPEAALCEIYDGDTPPSRRARIRRHPPRVLITNPDMLHLGILSYWESWRPFLAELRWLVLDELHTYRGIFGSHFHHVLQRLLRLCRQEGARPVLIASSATAGNAGEFAETLTGLPFRWIARSGAPREARHVLLLRPEASPYTSALHLLVLLLEAGLKTIVFTKARRITELLHSWLARQRPELAPRVASYRAGFLPEERRTIEQDLFHGRLDGVIATSALEMGIDVGGLDACVLVGYPGSMMATWQRSGRVGRAGRESLTALVALPDALDQYLLDHPQEFLGRPYERLVVDPANEPVTRSHLLCAAAERPLHRERDRDYLERHAPVVEALLREHELREAAQGGELYAALRRPHRRVNLRGTGETFAIHHRASGAVVGTVDGVRVLHECHPGAVYLHGGRQFAVTELDLPGRRVTVRPVAVDHFTTPLTEKETEILEPLAERADGALRAWLGRIKVTERVVGFERKQIYSQETIGQQSLDLPPTHLETVGLWWAVPGEVEEALRQAGEHFLGALHASEHAAISLFPLLALCDRGDIGGISCAFHPQVGTGAVFIYDGHPGGVGLAARGFQELPALLARVRELVAACPCQEGCPSCIQSPKCGNGNRPLDKPGAVRVLDLLLGGEKLASPRIQIHAVAGPSRQVSTETMGETPEREPSPVSRPPRPGGRSDDSSYQEVQDSVPATVLFDLETLRSAEEVGGWENAHRMGVAVGVLYHLEEGRFEAFGEAEVQELLERLAAARLVVGFNIKRFDYRVLSGYTGADYARLLPTLDLLEEIYRRLGFRLGLDHLARETLGVGKTADGLQSLEWVKQGRLDLVEAYCRRDVEILRDLYLHGRREGYVFYRDRDDRRIKLPVEW